MENKNQTESGFRVINLILMESNFKREAVVTFDQDQITPSLKVDVNVQFNEDSVYVTETIEFAQMNKQTQTIEVSAKVQMAGVFEKYGDSPLNVEEFGYVNGAAIIFPFIREQLMNLSVKAGITAIVLPPFNFTRKKD